MDLVAQPLALTACALGKTTFSVALLLLGVRTWIRVGLRAVIVSVNVLRGLVSIFALALCEDPRTQWVQGAESECWDPDIFVQLGSYHSRYVRSGYTMKE